MSEFKSLPNSISHKKLSQLFSKAEKDFILPNNSTDIEEEEFLEVLENWESVTKELMKKISVRKDNFFKNKSSNSLMAVGALEVHLNMALQAYNVFKNDPKN
tara:strand:+ start:12922 stop:13227 length:306 start_codon:yes stop_codon:yes gene_type:complete